MFCNVFRHCSGPDWFPDEVHLEHTRTGNWRSIETAFRAPVRFECQTNALLFRPERALNPMPKADHSLLQLLCHNIKTLGLSERAASVNVLAESYIRENASHGNVTLEGAGHALRITPRMLQRRLAEENSSFAALDDQL